MRFAQIQAFLDR